MRREARFSWRAENNRPVVPCSTLPITVLGVEVLYCSMYWYDIRPTTGRLLVPYGLVLVDVSIS